jgi:hypothetical protein
LPESAFGKFPEVGTLEIHLATGFQNMIYDRLPEEMVEEAYDLVRQDHKGKWKEGKTEDQFLYSNRKRVLGDLKDEWWHLDAERQEEIGAALEEKFAFLFDKLNVKETGEVAQAETTVVELHKPRPTEAAAEVAGEDVSDLAD